MSEQQNFGFGKFVPGFDFLQNLSKGAGSQTQTGMPSLSNWVAPTLNVEELDKRVGELKAVQFWLEQNSRALAATIQALVPDVQPLFQGLPPGHGKHHPLVPVLKIDGEAVHRWE